jgi:endonuclease/exonuclease/phosphatase family metal-dependent hydrolase
MSPPPEPELRVATWNIHDARGRDGERDLDRVAEMLGQLRAPLVGLQEVRCGSEACDAATLARQHGYHWHAIETWRHGDAQYGNALLTTLPVESTQVHDLSVGSREPPLFALDRVWVSPPWRVSAVSSLQAPSSRTVSDHLPVIAPLRRDMGWFRQYERASPSIR